MIIFRRRDGQTLIETALILFLLLLILLGITEFARAWFAKNSLKNAARQGARLAVVTPSATDTVCPVNLVCDQTRGFTSCPGSDIIVNSVCASPGVSSAANPAVSICYRDETEGTAGVLDRGDTVNVCARTNFSTVVPRIMGGFIPSQFYAAASMRYE